MRRRPLQPFNSTTVFKRIDDPLLRLCYNCAAFAPTVTSQLTCLVLFWRWSGSSVRSALLVSLGTPDGVPLAKQRLRVRSVSERTFGIDFLLRS